MNDASAYYAANVVGNISATDVTQINGFEGAVDNGPSTQAQIEQYKAAVQANPLDFTSWTQLLSLVESETTTPMETVEATFDQFLSEFPLCFGYWNKYAQYEYGLMKQTGADGKPLVDPSEACERAKQVYERGCVAVRYSVDMWLKYCEFLMSTLGVPADESRAALEKALEACSYDPAAGPLWDLYIQLETINNDMVRLNNVFKRILAHPLSNLEEFWDKYNAFVLAQQLSTLATTEELKQLAGENEHELMDEGLLRVKIVNGMESLKNATLHQVLKRQGFENNIDRTYFHVTPVSDSSLRNWHSYLDFEEVTGDADRCRALYRRCLVPCANYEPFWLRFAKWEESVRGFDAANDIFHEAMDVCLKGRARFWLDYAFFLEAHEQFEKAEEMYDTVMNTNAPTLAEAYVKAAHYYRRRQDMSKAKEVLAKGEQNVQQEDAKAYVVIESAEFLLRFEGKTDEARACFQQAVDGGLTSSLLLFEHWIQFEKNMGPTNLVTRVSNVFEKAVSDTSGLGREEKADVWIQYAQFLEEFADNVAVVNQVQVREVTWRRKNNMPRSRDLKVLVFHPAGDGVQEPPMKRARVEAPLTSVQPQTTPDAQYYQTNAQVTPSQTYAAYYQYPTQ